MLWLPRVCLLFSVLLVGFGLLHRCQPTDLEPALAELLDGDADRKERLVCLAVVRDRGLERAGQGDTRAGLLAAMAAIDLDDEDGFRRAVKLLAGRTAFVPGGGSTPAGTVEEASLGEPYLRSLMLGHAAENRGEPAEAGRRFRQAMLSADRFGAELARTLAAAGLERVR